MSEQPQYIITEEKVKELICFVYGAESSKDNEIHELFKEIRSHPYNPAQQSASDLKGYYCTVCRGRSTCGSFGHVKHCRDFELDIIKLDEIRCSQHISTPTNPEEITIYDMTCPDGISFPDYVNKSRAGASGAARDRVLDEAIVKIQAILEDPNKTLPWIIAPLSQTICLLQSLRTLKERP
jgi:hypothetical protein